MSTQYVMYPPPSSGGGGGGGVTTVGTIDSQTASGNGGVISGVDLYFQSASASNPGLVNTTTQTFAGAKTFGSQIKIPSGNSTNPAIIFTGQATNTGIWSVSNAVVFTSSGTNLLTFGGGLIELGAASLVWTADDTGNIGSATPGSDAGRPSNIYAKTNIQVGTSGGTGGTFTLAGTSSANLLWATDGGGNIGASAASRPARIYSQALTLANGSSANPSLQFTSLASNSGMWSVAGAIVMTIAGTNYQTWGGGIIEINANIVGNSDGGFNIGVIAGSAGADAGRPNNVYVKNLMLSTGGIGVGNSAAATTPGSVVKKIQVFDDAGASLGYLAVYSSIS